VNIRLALLVALAGVALWFYSMWWRTERRGAPPSSIERRPATPFEYLLGFVTNFFDTLGIGSFAPTTAAFKLRRMMPDEYIPGTLNVGHTSPTFAEAFIFIAAVRVDPALLVSTIGAAVVGAWLGVRLLVRMQRRTLQLIVGAALLIGAATFTMTNLELMPGGGTASALAGWRFGLAVGVHLLLGALLTAGIGLFAPSMMTLALLGLHPLLAFPIMMGACAFVTPVASQRFFSSGRYALGPALGLGIAGVFGVLIAAFVVESMELTTLRWLVVVVVLYAGVMSLRSALSKPGLARAAALCALVALLPWPVRGEGDGLPLSPTRQISFETSEGTWMSVDVSPDGSTIVFDLLGDLYLLPIGGGDSHRLTDGFTFNAQPRFSPDGRRIAFVSDRGGSENLWVMSADGGGAASLSNEADQVFISPEWSPDGTFLVVSKTGKRRDRLVSLWRYGLDGGAGRELLNTDPAGEKWMALGAAFGREPGRVHFAAKPLALVTESPNLGEYQLASLDLATQQLHPVSNVGRGGALRPVLSPDGKWLVYATRHDANTALRLRNLATGEETWLRYPVTRDEQESRHPSWDLHPGSSFTPDSRSLITTAGGKLWQLDIPSGRASPIPFRALVEKRLAPLLSANVKIEEGPTVRARQILHPALSPDGKRLAFGALGAVWVMELPRGKPQRISPEGVDGFQPSWSSDGRSILFGTWRPNSGGHVMRIGGDGRGAAVALTRTAAFYQWPTYSPDGGRIAVVRSSRQAAVDDLLTWGVQDFRPRAGVRAGLHWLPAKGGETKQIVALPYAARPQFAGRDGRIHVHLPVRGDGYGGETHGVTTPIPGLGMYSIDFGGAGWKLDFAQEGLPRELQGQEALLTPDGDGALASDAAGRIHHIDRSGERLATRRLSGLGGDSLSGSPRGADAIYALGSSVFLHDVRSDARREIPVRVEVPRSRAVGTLVLRGARVITMRGDEVIEHADIVIVDGRIAAVGPEGSVRVPVRATVRDVAGKTIVPGFVDAHSHILGGRVVFHPQQPWEFLTHLSHGVTTAFDPSPAPAMITLADRVASGEFRGPRFFGAGPDPHMPDAAGIVDLESARQLISRLKSRGFDAVKQYAFAGRDKRQWVALAAAEQGLRAMTEGNAEVKPAISEILDGYTTHEHYFTMYPLYRDFIELVARSGTAYNPTLLIAHGANGGEEYFYKTEDLVHDAKMRAFMPPMLINWMARRRDQIWMKGMVDDEYPFRGYAQAAGRISRAGGRVGVGSHGQLQGLGYHWEMWALAEGMAPHETLRAATLHGAHSIGLGQELGSIETGKIADLLVLDRNPLESIRNTRSLRYLMQGGRLLEAGTLEELWPQRRSFEFSKWWPEEPLLAQY
jgi:Tol biopolymer transport system component/uncharacterized membrane protein YfcA